MAFPSSGAGAAAYSEHARTTASPGQLLVMLYDRLLLDLDRAGTALRAGRNASEHLLHAQEIVMELLTTLDTSAWSGASALSSVYAYLHGRLVLANVRGQADVVAECRDLVEPLRHAWHAAAHGGPVESITDAPVRRVSLAEPVSA